MDPFVFMLFLLGFIFLMIRTLPDNRMGTAKCPDCSGPYGYHFPRCKRVK
jgi:hypothetical protein